MTSEGPCDTEDCSEDSLETTWWNILGQLIHFLWDILLCFPCGSACAFTWQMKPVELHCRTHRLNFLFFLLRSSLSVHVVMNTGSSSIKGSWRTWGKAACLIWKLHHDNSSNASFVNAKLLFKLFMFPAGDARWNHDEDPEKRCWLIKLGMIGLLKLTSYIPYRYHKKQCLTQ